MNKVNKLFNVILAIVLVFTMAIPAFAAGQTGSISIDSADNVSVDGKVFNAYKILDAKAVNTEDLSQGVVYTIPDSMKTFFTSYGGDADAVVAKLRDMSADDLNAFAELALAAAKTADIKEETATGAEGKATFANIPFGYYVIADITDATVDGEQIISAVMLDTTNSNVQLSIKADKPSITKKIDGDKDTDESTNGLVDYNNAAIGDKITYVLTSAVPETTGYASYVYTVTDTLSKGLLFNNDVAITIGGETLEANKYAVAKVDVDGSTKVTITFDNKVMVSAKANDEIIITYTATVDTDAVIGVKGNPNVVDLTYSNNPLNESQTETTPKDITRTFVTGINITKVDATTKAKLEGAEFKLTGTKLNTVVVTDANNAEGKVITKAENVVYSGVSDKNGIVTFEGLAAGQYAITEIVAPDGYNLLDKPVEITISWTAPADDSADCSWTVEPDSSADVKDGIVEVVIENSTGSLLPETGGMGTTILYIVGAILVVGAVILLITKKRMSAEA